VRIVHVYKDYHPPVRGGIEQTLERIAREQARAGHDVTVLVSASGGRRTVTETIDGVRVVRVAEWARALSSPICPGFPAELAKLTADLWHLHFPNPMGELSWQLVSPPGALLVTYYADVVRQKALMPLYGPLLHGLLDRADRVQVISPQALARDDSPLARHRANCRCVPLGVDVEPLLGLDRDGEAARSLRARFGDPYILFVGRLRAYKGLDVLLAAMPSVPARLVIVGDGPMGPRLRAQAAELGLGEQVVFAGSVSDADLRDHLAAAGVGVLPSSQPSEAYGLAMVEYLAAGMPAVCTELGTGTTFVNEPGTTGLAVPPNDAPALAAALADLVRDPERRAAYGAAGRRRARDMFTTQAMMRGLDELYRETIAIAAARRGSPAPH
jgi:rhamnosyl/mannosyltransferase